MSAAESSIDAFILAGGASRRMGRDKSRLSLDGRSFVERIAAALYAIAGTVRLVGARDPEAGLMLPNVPDLHPGWGALGGLETALAAGTSEWTAVAACDLPFVTGALFTRLVSLRGTFDAVVPVQEDGRPQPLCALYRRKDCAELAGRLVAEGERRPRALLTQVQTRWVTPQELADLDDAGRFFLNINTPQDFTLATSKTGG